MRSMAMISSSFVDEPDVRVGRSIAMRRSSAFGFEEDLAIGAFGIGRAGLAFTDDPFGGA